MKNSTKYICGFHILTIVLIVELVLTLLQCGTILQMVLTRDYPKLGQLYFAAFIIMGKQRLLCEVSESLLLSKCSEECLFSEVCEQME